ncbi:MAG: class I adenylate cyclase [Deltaproteobacteria bacterium]|nr:class I adenylate cyclase [Deltaproteobacteria bacterium]MBW2053286.1 class I adenylate cyclase [Deltaproteobacteria bacterium]MBW2140513.1 class I adenylate cyclase [Deltaproteobacteria bacterium]MBW2324038.1 class I adenylate cyclase [Deltaproteobacteria bacterium]
MNLFEKILGRKKDGDQTSAQPIPEPGIGATGDKVLFQNLQTFKQYNKEKKEFLYRLLSKRKKIIYDVIPYLIHIQASELLPAADACRLSPCGIYNFEPSPQIEKSFEQAFPDREMLHVHPHASLDPNLPIKSISLLGSLGSIAQNNKSDFDYWVCIEREAFDQNALNYFMEKLRAIEQWAANFAAAEVHFFPLSVDAVRADAFGEVDSERSGTAQGKLLKEEFYRTMTLVTGQIPMWWIMPPWITDEEYDRLKQLVVNSQIINSSELVDLGNIHDISLGEFYGAAIWQINKTMGSPFKSVLKLALLEEYLFNQGKKGPLCHELKSKLFSKVEDIRLLDPYILMFDRVAEYFTSTDRTQDLDLLRRSMYLKSGVKLKLSDYRRTNLPRKKQVMVNNVRRWGWNHRYVDRLNNYSNWSFQEFQNFNQEVNRFLTLTYKNISTEHKKQSVSTGLNISSRDMTVLGRKLYIYYSRRSNKIESIVSVVANPPTLKGLTLQQLPNNRGNVRWYAYQGMLSQESVLQGQGNSFILKSSPFLDEILAWLVFNRIYNTETTINLNRAPKEKPQYITVPLIQDQLRALTDFYPLFKYQEINETELLKPARITKMFLSLNIQAPEWSKEITDTSVCYLNSWGELFFKGFNSDQGIYLAREFILKNFAYDLIGARKNFYVFLPKREFARNLGPKLDKFFGFKVS